MDGITISPRDKAGMDDFLGALKLETDRLVTLIGGLSHVDPGVRESLAGHASDLFNNIATANDLSRKRMPEFDTLARCQHCLRVSGNIASSWSRDLCFLCDEGAALGNRLLSSFQGAGQPICRALDMMTELPAGKDYLPLIRVNPYEYFLICEDCGSLAASFFTAMDFFHGRRYMVYWGEKQVMLSDGDAARIRDFLHKKDLRGLDEFFRREGIDAGGIPERCDSCGRILCKKHRPCQCTG